MEQYMALALKRDYPQKKHSLNMPVTSNPFQILMVLRSLFETKL